MKNLSAWDLLGLVIMTTMLLFVFGAVENCARQKALETKADVAIAAKVKVTTVDTDPRCYPIQWAKITADGHEYLVFQPAGNGQSVMHSVSCTNCVPKQITWGNPIDWNVIPQCTTTTFHYSETQL